MLNRRVNPYQLAFCCCWLSYLLTLLTPLSLLSSVSMLNHRLSTRHEAFGGFIVTLNASCPPWLVDLVRHVERQVPLVSNIPYKHHKALLSANSGFIELSSSVYIVKGVKYLRLISRDSYCL